MPHVNATAVDDQRGDHRELWQCTGAQSAKELGAGPEADREHEQQEEDVLQPTGDLNPQLTDDETGDQATQHRPRLKRAEAHLFQRVSDRQNQEQRQRRILTQRVAQPRHGPLLRRLHRWGERVTSKLV